MMRATAILLAVALGLIVGCGKGKPTEAEPSAESGGVKYAIRLPGRDAPDMKHAISTSTSMEVVVTIGDKQHVSKTGENSRYIEAESGESITRTYQHSYKTDKDGVKHDNPYSRGVVVIVKKGDAVTITLDGRPLNGAKGIEREFDAPPLTSEIPDMLPAVPVAVGESWSVSKDVLRKRARRTTGTLDPEKSSISGKLLKAYKEGGKQWGVIEWKVEIIAPASDGPQSGKGSFTLESPIDGSNGETKLNATFGGSWVSNQGGAVVVNRFERKESIVVAPVIR